MLYVIGFWGVEMSRVKEVLGTSSMNSYCVQDYSMCQGGRLTDICVLSLLSFCIFLTHQVLFHL